MKTESIEIRCTPKMKQAIREFAKHKNMTITELIEYCVTRQMYEMFTN